MNTKLDIEKQRMSFYFNLSSPDSNSETEKKTYALEKLKLTRIPLSLENNYSNTPPIFLPLEA